MEFNKLRDLIEALACGLVIMAIVPVGALICALLA